MNIRSNDKNNRKLKQLFRKGHMTLSKISNFENPFADRYKN